MPRLTYTHPDLAGSHPDILSGRRATFLMALMALGCALMTFWTPWNHDDLHYRLAFMPPGAIGSECVGFPSPGQWLEFASGHWLHVNGRVGDKLLPLALLLPKWMFALLTGLACYVLLDAGRLVSRRLSSPCARLTCAALMLLCLPWHNLMFTGAFAVNYLWGGALALLCFAFMTGTVRASGPWARTGVCLLALLAGGWHEGYAMTLGASMPLILALRGREPGKWPWLWWALWMCGTALVVFSPSSWQRMDRSGGDFTLQRLLDPKALAWFNAALLCLPAVALSLPWRRFRKRAGRLGVSLLCGACLMQLVNFYIIGRTYWEPRITIFSSLFTLPALLLTMRLWFPAALSPRWRRAANLSATALALLCLLHLTLCLHWQRRLWREYSDVLDAWRAAGKDDMIYFDLTLPDSIPLMTLGKPSAYQLHNTWGLTTFMRYYGGKKGSLRILPERLRGADPKREGTLLPGRVRAYRTRGLIVAVGWWRKRDLKLTYTWADGTRCRLKTLATPWTAPGGARYTLLEPLRGPFDSEELPVRVD